MNRLIDETSTQIDADDRFVSLFDRAMRRLTMGLNHHLAINSGGPDWIFMMAEKKMLILSWITVDADAQSIAAVDGYGSTNFSATCEMRPKCIRAIRRAFLSAMEA